MSVASVAESKSDAGRMAANRASARDLLIPDTLNPDRRAEYEADDLLWLQKYCAKVFYSPFTAHQIKIIADCGEALRYGTQKCKAAPRGDGKSSIVKYLALKYALTRAVRFPLIIAATSSKAKKILESLKHALAGGVSFSQRTKTFKPLTMLGEDYPLECCAANYVHPWPSRARNITANGQQPIHVEWGADGIILPTWEDKEPLGPIIYSLGFTSDDLQGCNIYDQRPDFVMLDDLDSRDSLASEDGVVAGKIEEVIDKTIAGLGGQSRQLGQFMLCTITSKESAAAKYSDPAHKPAWSGERIAAIQVWPDRQDLREEYVKLRQNGKRTLDADGKPVDVFGREAHRFYLANKEDIERGAVLANPHNFERTILPDGTQKQISALQRCFDYIADNGMASFLTEHQNDPPDETGEEAVSGISPFRVNKKLNRFKQREVPPGCTVLGQGIDAGKRALHWVVKAWAPDGSRGHVVDYGIKLVSGLAASASDDAVDDAMRAMLIEHMQDMRDTEYMTPDGQLCRPGKSLIDVRYRTSMLCLACEELNTSLPADMSIQPLMGWGQSQGCVGRSYHEQMQRTKDKRPGGESWCETRKQLGTGRDVWIVNVNADFWKAWEHDRWMTPGDKPGSLFLCGIPGDDPKRVNGPDEIDHRDRKFPEHICNEIEIEEGGKRKWKPKGPNHWLDASSYANVSAHMLGVSLHGAVGETQAVRKKVSIPAHMRRA